MWFTPEPRRARTRALICGVMLTASWLACGCSSGSRGARETVDNFLGAVQERDSTALFCLMTGVAESEELGADAPARREGFAAWFDAQLEAYDVGRDAGAVELNGHGILAVKLFALGKGTFFDLTAIDRPGPDSLRVRMDIRFGYSALDLSGFSPGTTFYVCGVPPGRVHAIRVPRRSGEESVQALERLSLEWTLARGTGSEGCRNEWTVASARVLAETASTTRITWAF